VRVLAGGAMGLTVKEACSWLRFQYALYSFNGTHSGLRALMAVS
jgi:hypothetical protein